MRYLICIDKERWNNQIQGYQLADVATGVVFRMNSDTLKREIHNKRVVVTNLALTKNNRLINRIQNTESNVKKFPKNRTKEIEGVKQIIAKAKLLGRVKTIDTLFNEPKCYLAHVSNTEHILYIPDKVTRCHPRELLRHIEGKLQVVGGSDLIETTEMFRECTAEQYDFTYFDTRNVKDMSRMFHTCAATSLDLSMLNTSKVTDMSYMFYQCNAVGIVFNGWDTSNVTRMEHMFDGCNATCLDLTTFNTSSVTNMESMFAYCKARRIIIDSFDTSMVTTMKEMFMGCNSECNFKVLNTSYVTNMSNMFSYQNRDVLDLSTFDTSSVKYFESMFASSRFGTLDLSSFDTTKAGDVSNMFNGCLTRVLDLTTFYIKSNCAMMDMLKYSGVEKVIVSKDNSGLLLRRLEVIKDTHKQYFRIEKK